MKPFLYLDNWHEPQSETRFDICLKASGLQVELMRTNSGNFPEHTDYSGAYVSPSFDGAYDEHEWIQDLHEVLVTLACSGVPMIGLCFGSQVLASALVGRDQVFVRESRETGYGKIQLTAAAARDSLASALPGTMPVFHWHGDEVRADHPDVIVLGESSDCSNQIWRWSQGPVWGVQPHLEFDRSGLIAWFENNQHVFEDAGMARSRLEKEAHDSEAGFGLLQNFVGYVVSREGRPRGESAGSLDG